MVKQRLFFLKVANYINGGHYAPHHDYVMKEKDPGHVSFNCVYSQKYAI